MIKINTNIIARKKEITSNYENLFESIVSLTEINKAKNINDLETFLYDIIKKSRRYQIEMNSFKIQSLTIFNLIIINSILDKNIIQFVFENNIIKDTYQSVDLNIYIDSLPFIDKFNFSDIFKNKYNFSFFYNSKLYSAIMDDYNFYEIVQSYNDFEIKIKNLNNEHKNIVKRFKQKSKNEKELKINFLININKYLTIDDNFRKKLENINFSNIKKEFFTLNDILNI